MLKIQRARRNNVQISKCSSRATEASTVHTSHRVHAVMPANVENTARGAEIPAIPAKSMPLALLTTSAATSSSTCEQGEKRRESTSGSRVYPFTQKIVQILPKATQDKAEHVSTVEPSIAHSQTLHQRAQRPCPRTGRRPKPLQLRRLHSFLRDQPEHLSLHNNRRVHNQPKTVPVKVHGLAQCALCVPRSASSWNVHHSVDELKEGPKTAGTYAAYSQGHPQQRDGQYFYPALAWRCTPQDQHRSKCVTRSSRGRK